MPKTRARKIAKIARRVKGVAKIRMMAACLRKRGMSIRKIAAELYVPRSTVYDWLLRMHKRGPKGRFDKRRRGKKRILDNACLKNLSKWLAEKPDKHGLGAGDWQWNTILELIKVKTGTVCSMRTIRRALRKIHKSYRKLNPVPHNSASKDEQERFKGETSARLEDLRTEKKGYVAFTWDEGTVQMYSNNGYAWRTTNGGDTLPTNFSKKGAKMFCAVREGGLHVWTADATNSDTFVETLKELQGEYPKIVMILDNASYHKSKTVMNHVESVNKDPRLGLELIFLPPYTPQLNPTEIQIREIKKRVAGMMLDSVDDLKETITTMVKRGEARPVKLMDYLLPKKDDPLVSWNLFIDSLDAQAS